MKRLSLIGVCDDVCAVDGEDRIGVGTGDPLVVVDEGLVLHC